MNRALPYVLTALGLLSGLAVLLFEPLPTPRFNHFLGGALLLLAVLSVGFMIIEGGGPGRRGPDF